MLNFAGSVGDCCIIFEAKACRVGCLIIPETGQPKLAVTMEVDSEGNSIWEIISFTTCCIGI